MDISKRFIIVKVFFLFQMNTPTFLKCAILLFTIWDRVCGQGLITVTTKLGNITGIRTSVGSADVYEFRKIPYAKPPIGNNRFEKPKEFGSWGGQLDATIFGPSSYQPFAETEPPLPNKNISEDCLHLNIYVPFDVTPSIKKSVMVWIHGGGFNVGQAMFYDGSHLAVTGNVIVVTINYRLGIFGFMSMADEASLGNYGLWDQIMAINWIRDNIASFGGDKESLTIFGQSGGSMSVGLLSIMPQNRGLFQRAILQSGTPIYPFSEYLGNAHLPSIIGNLNCSNSNTSAVIDCLKKLTTEQFAPTLQEYFAPVVDGELLTDDPINLLMNASSEASLFFQSIDMIIGTCSSEGAFFILIAELLKDTYHFNVTEGLPKTVLCDYLAPLISKDYQNPRVSTAICNKYGQNTNSAELSMDIVNAYSDYYFNSLSVRLLRFHARGKSKRFQYLFSRMPAKSLIMPNPPSWFTGAAHGDELVYQFDFFPLSLSDMGLADAMNTYWANFARTG